MRRTRPNRLVEAAMSVSDLPDGLGVQVEILKAGSAANVRIVRLDTGKPALQAKGDPIEGLLRVASEKAFGPADDAWMVAMSSASSGWGPLLYDVAIEVATKLGGGLMADRQTVSPHAHAVWVRYVSGRSDVNVHQLDRLDEPHLTKSKKDDVDQTGSAADWAKKTGKDWTEVPESKRLTKKPTTLSALAKAGRLVLTGVTPAALGVSLLKSKKPASAVAEEHVMNRQRLKKILSEGRKGLAEAWRPAEKIMDMVKDGKITPTFVFETDYGAILLGFKDKSALRQIAKGVGVTLSDLEDEADVYEGKSEDGSTKVLVKFEG